VAEVYVGVSGPIGKGEPIFRLDSSKQEAAVESARRKIAEAEAEIRVAQADIHKAEGQIEEAKAAEQQTVDELQTKRELQRRNPGNVASRDIEKLEVALQGRKGAVAAAMAAKQQSEERIATLLPAQKASAEAALAETEVQIQKTIIRAGVNGRVEQFALLAGDMVNPIMRPAGLLIPSDAGKRFLHAGFGQIEAQIMKVGMIAEATCASKPWTIIPMVVTDVQDYVAAGQFRGGEQLIEAQQITRPGTLFVYLEPLYEGGLDGVTPGSSCIANAYSNNHDTIVKSGTGTLKRALLHVVDALALVHALILRLQALVFPFQTLVFGGH
jgi:multidrug resistance efflux pump